MADRRPYSWHEPDISSLPPDSYTAFRLQHATPEHLHQTSRRFFIGPIPEGWLKTHRRDWYKQHSQTSAARPVPTSYPSDPRQARQRQLSGLDGPSSSALFSQSFPQPEDLSDDDDEETGQGQNNGGANAKQDEPSGKSVPTSKERSNGPLSVQDTGSIASPSEEELARPEADDGLSDRASAREDSRGVSSPTSFVTASTSQSVHSKTLEPQEQEQASSLQVPSQQEEDQDSRTQYITPVESNGAPSTRVEASLEATSTTSLLRNANVRDSQAQPAPQSPPKGILSKMKRRSNIDQEISHTETAGTLTRTKSHIKQLVKFDIPEDSKRAELHLKAKSAQMKVQRASSRLRRPKVKDGLIVKMERMLVRVDVTGQDVPEDFDENENQKIDSRVKDKWREYMVVCRQCVSEDADFVLQMYKTRVIPEIEKPNTNKRAHYEIPLSRRIAQVNLYSSLDKSVVVWLPVSRGARIFIMQARTASNAVEWYTFMRNILGWRRASELQINVPDLSINLRIHNPFQKLEASQSVAADDSDDNEEAVMQTMKEEQAVTQNLIRRCVQMLGEIDEWKDVLETWLKTQRIGLAWKRYDRLEWIHGANEKRMYGTVGMLRTHDLELRPKLHYPTTAVTRKKHKTLTEPEPVEGFLIRLTSQRGTTRRLGLLYHKQLYFSSHDRYLIFNRPAKAIPPPPPKLPGAENEVLPEAADIAQNLPDTWSVNPYPLKNNEIAWLSSGSLDTSEARRLHDDDAQDEANRKAHNLLNCDGYINLCNVSKVRKAHKGAVPAVDDNIESGSDVGFDEDVNDDATREDGVTTDFEVDRTLEIVMQNGLIMRLQAADKERRKQWVQHLRALVKYWKLRTASDIGLFISTREQNLKTLNIDEEGEATIGQYAKKWEVSHAYASTDLYNICGIATCRSIHMSGTLYRKPRIHAPFTRCGVILTAGTLCIFRDVLRSKTGKLLKHIHHDHIANLDLKDCYIYSGLLTEPDLLYQNQTFDSNKPGHHALPRIYLEDGWTSTDEDVMTTFVVWHGKSKSWFRAEEGAGAGEVAQKDGKRTKLKRVAKLGSTGRSVVFRARSRAERDHWVLAIQNEIERVQLGRGEDFRIEEVAREDE